MSTLHHVDTEVLRAYHVKSKELIDGLRAEVQAVRRLISDLMTRGPENPALAVMDNAILSWDNLTDFIEGVEIGVAEMGIHPDLLYIVRLRTSSNDGIQIVFSKDARSWSTLSREQQRLLIKYGSDIILELDDVPQDILAQAYRDWWSDNRDRLPLFGYELRLELNARVGMIELSAGLMAEEITYADGTIEVVVELTGSLGAEFGSKVTVEAGAETSYLLRYRFRNIVERDLFKTLLLAAGGTGNVVGMVDIMHSDPALVNAVGKVGMYMGVEVDMGPLLEAGLRVSAGVGRDFHRGEDLMYFAGEFELEVEGGGKNDLFELELDIDAEYRVSQEGSRIVIEGMLNGSSEALDAHLGIADVGSWEPGARVWAEWDLNDPLSAAIWEQFAVGEATFAEVYDRGDVVISATQVGGAMELLDVEGDMGIIAKWDGEAEARAKVYTATVIKLPGRAHRVAVLPTLMPPALM